MSTGSKAQFIKQLQQPAIRADYTGTAKLHEQVAIITGGDSGIGRSVAVHFAREGAHVAIVYLKNDKDAHVTKAMVEQEGRTCLLFKGDVSRETFCNSIVSKTFNPDYAIACLKGSSKELVLFHSPENHSRRLRFKASFKTYRSSTFSK